jgi:hypothetical protein
VSTTDREKNFLRKCNGRLREIESPLSLPLDFFEEVDDNVQVAMTNEEQKEAGTEAFPSLIFFFSLALFFHKKIISSMYTRACVCFCMPAHPMKIFHQS